MKRGCDRGGKCVDEEEWADAIGLDLLKAHGVPSGAMVSMLEKVAMAEDSASPCHRIGCRVGRGYRHAIPC